MRVVGWLPVPNAKPGSSLKLIAFGSAGSHQLGTIHKPGATQIGWNCCCVLRTQSSSAIVAMVYAGTAAPKTALTLASAFPASASFPNSADRRHTGQRSAAVGAVIELGSP